MSRKYINKNVIIIAIILLASLAGIIYYGFKTNTKNMSKNESESQNGNISAHEVKNNVGDDKIKLLNNVTDLRYLVDKDEYLYVKDRTLIYHKKNEEQEIRKLPDNSGVNVCGISEGYIIFLEMDVEGKDIKKSIGIKRLYIYDIKNKVLTKAAETKLVKAKDNTQNAASEISDEVRISGKKIFFCRENCDKPGDNTIYMYDIESRSTQIIYREYAKNNEVILFDVDMDKGYLVIEEEGEIPYTLYLVNLKNSKKRMLVNSKLFFPVKTDYPNIAFSFKNTIHLYNIEKNDDDICINCDCMPQNINLRDKKLFFDAPRTFCYSLKSKKLYKVDSRKNVNDYTYSRLDDKTLYWWDEDSKIHYMKLDDVK